MSIEADFFEQPIQRRGTGSFKWDLEAMQGVLPMWVADMDFSSPPAVIDALVERARHGVFGYALVPPSLTELVVQRYEERHGWSIDPSWIVWLPGLETALTLASLAVGQEGDQVLCMDPIYPPFYGGPRKAGREVSRPSLLRQGGRWVLDWERLEEILSMPQTKLWLFCHPHNPVGEVFGRSTCERVAEMCLRHGVVLCSDEVHGDLSLDGSSHICMGSLGKEAERNSITLMAPSKTFNIAGLGCGWAVIPDEKLRQSFQISMRSITPMLTPMGFTACEAALRHGEAWRQELIGVLKRRVETIDRFVAQQRGIQWIPPRASYLAWLDVGALGLDDPAAHFKAHGLGLSPGRIFGDPNHVRLNFGCPEKTLVEGLQRMERAISALG